MSARDEAGVVQGAACGLGVALANFLNVAGGVAGVAIETLTLRVHGLEFSVEVRPRGGRKVFVVGDLTVGDLRGVLEEALGEVAVSTDYEGGGLGFRLVDGKQLNMDCKDGVFSVSASGEISNGYTDGGEAGHLAPIPLGEALALLRRIRGIE